MKDKPGLYKWSPENESNQETVNITDWSERKILEYGVAELLKIHNAIQDVIDECHTAASIITRKLKAGGRIITFGAGGSGVAAMSVMREIPQNHRDLSPDNVTYRIAGQAGILDPLGCEELEDDPEEGICDIDALKVGADDVVILVSATGRTPYTRAASNRAKDLGAYTIGIVCQRSELLSEVDLPILVEVGPEMFVGATCEMSATAQKHILDMIMNVVVVNLGITDGNKCRARLIHEKAKTRDAFFAKAS